MLYTLLYFFLALLLLVLVHEFGHFWVARCCGVKVLRFSFGFGKVLWRWHDKHGTEYTWSLLPIGGYVKFLGEEEDHSLSKEEQQQAFNRQSFWIRSMIVVAGPLFNFLFAWVLLWLVWMIGIQSLAPIIERVEPGSIAAHAGLGAQQEIIALNGYKIASWHDFQYAFMPMLGSEKTAHIIVKTLQNGQKKSCSLPLTPTLFKPHQPDVLAGLGIVPWIPVIPLDIGEVVPQSPAQLAGFKPHDRLISMENRPIKDWFSVVDFIKRHPDQRVNFVVAHHGQHRRIDVKIGHHEHHGQLEGFLGVRSGPVQGPQGWLRLQQKAPWDALQAAFVQTTHLTGSTFILMGRLIVGHLPLASLSGPVSIAKHAGESAQSGWVYYLSFLALVSISLGVLNLLPIPMLDGGHLVYYLIEALLQRTLSDTFKSVSMLMGLMLLGALMLIALGNDIRGL